MGLILNRGSDADSDVENEDEKNSSEQDSEGYDTPAELERETGNSSLGAHPEKTPSEIAEM